MKKEEIKVPPLGESVTMVIVGHFLKPSGSTVSDGDEIVELETEKLNQVLYAPFSGVIDWHVKEGDEVAVGAFLGTVEEKEGVKASSPQEEKKPSPPPAAPLPAAPLKQEEKIRISKEEWLKEETPKDEPKKTAQPSSNTPTLKGTRRKMSKIRQLIAKRLKDALHEAAMLTTFNEIDMSEVIHLRTRYQESFKEKFGVKLGFMSFFVKACVKALEAYPDIHSAIEGDEIVRFEGYDIGVAVGTDRGVIVPVLKNCDKRSFAEIEKEISSYAIKAREGGLTLDDLQGGTFTITNGGIYGSMLSTPLLNPPQSGILGMHKIEKRPVVVGDAIVIRPMMYVALSYDHRVVDGKEAVSFLVRVKEVLEDPTRLLFLEGELHGDI